jgi:hypothetical protein
MNEKRKHERLQFGFWMHDKSGKKSWVTEDISVGGCFLEAIESMPVGSKIDLVFELPGSSHYIEATGEVKHTRDGGMGLEFSNMDYKEKDEVDQFVRKYH